GRRQRGDVAVPEHLGPARAGPHRLLLHLAAGAAGVVVGDRDLGARRLGRGGGRPRTGEAAAGVEVGLEALVVAGQGGGRGARGGGGGWVGGGRGAEPAGGGRGEEAVRAVPRHGRAGGPERAGGAEQELVGLGGRGSRGGHGGAQVRRSRSRACGTRS